MSANISKVDDNRAREGDGADGHGGRTTGVADDIRCFKAGSCHLTTDGTLDDLHVFARRLGMKREWFQDHRLAPHYDLTAGRRALALEMGAVFVPMRRPGEATSGRVARERPSNVRVNMSSPGLNLTTQEMFAARVCGLGIGYDIDNEVECPVQYCRHRGGWCP